MKQSAGGYNSLGSLRSGQRRPARLRTASGVLLALTSGTFGSAAVAETHTHEGHAPHEPNTIALFVGRASEQRREAGLALGIEYERRLLPSFGIGALAEHTFGKIDTTVYAVPLAYHNGPWKAYLAPGFESGNAGNDRLVRVGIEYGFERGEYEIAPQVDLDFVDGQRVLVIGITFGKGF
ncbi:MAG: hypothetical protein V2J12_07330 [Gammaproteobacteria bacterium]|nr:hypothetical protein [Gammaproteobacteria bacterium]